MNAISSIFRWNKYRQEIRQKLIDNAISWIYLHSKFFFTLNNAFIIQEMSLRVTFILSLSFFHCLLSLSIHLICGTSEMALIFQFLPYLLSIFLFFVNSFAKFMLKVQYTINFTLSNLLIKNFNFNFLSNFCML